MSTEIKVSTVPLILNNDIYSFLENLVNEIEVSYLIESHSSGHSGVHIFLISSFIFELKQYFHD